MADREEMLMNWPERVWIYSPVRVWFLWMHARRWLRMRGPIEGENVLEIGCGLGKGARILVKSMGFRRVYAFDLEETLVHSAVKSLPRSLAHRISFFVGDAQTLPFGDEVFDAVVNYGIIHHVLDWRACVRELSRVMKPGGTFFFEEIYPPLYANPILGPLLRHPREDRFDEPQFLAELERNRLRLLPGTRTGSRFGLVAAAIKDP